MCCLICLFTADAWLYRLFVLSSDFVCLLHFAEAGAVAENGSILIKLIPQ